MRNRLREYPIGCKSEDGRLHDPVTATILGGAMLLGSAYTANQQGKAQKAASSAQVEADLAARKTLAEQKPLEATATLGFNAMDKSPLGSLGLLIEPDKAKRTSGLGTSKGGLGTSTSGLGFGG